MLGQRDRKRLGQVSERLYRASRRVRILGHLAWPASVRHRFFRSGSERLPEVEYPPFDAKQIKGELRQARDQLGDLPLDKWLKKKSRDIEASVNLIGSCGTPEFFRHSSEIYGTPTTMLRDGRTTPMDLARRFSLIMDAQPDSPNNRPGSDPVPVSEIRDRIEKKVNSVFGSESPRVVVVDGISAKATASSKRIRLRKGAAFTHRDVDQLINHEALVHVATTLNGRDQDQMRILGGNYGSVTKTQEGLAVFSEFITGCIDVARMRRIMARVEAIQMSIDGADFIQVYRFFLQRTRLKTEAFENARRIFRGGVMAGGYPFTKDIVYLDGLVRIHNFIRAVVSQGRHDALELLFAGKMELDDMPMVIKMNKEGLIRPPKYLPDWVVNRDYLVSYFALSIFIGEMDHQRTDGYYQNLF
tara:strand:- start:1827 stop:3071 length:1245 start_codon:yes stop_codon:yes gene_type:complete